MFELSGSPGPTPKNQLRQITPATGAGGSWDGSDSLSGHQPIIFEGRTAGNTSNYGGKLKNCSRSAAPCDGNTSNAVLRPGRVKDKWRKITCEIRYRKLIRKNVEYQICLCISPQMIVI